MGRCLSAARVLFRNRTRPLKIYAACIYHDDLPDSAVHFFPLRTHFFVSDYAHNGRSSILINFPTEILLINFVLRRHSRRCTYVYMYTCDSPTFFSCLVFDGGTRRCHLSPVHEVLQVVYMRMSFSCRVPVCRFSYPLMNPLGCNL